MSETELYQAGRAGAGLLVWAVAALLALGLFLYVALFVYEPQVQVAAVGDLSGELAESADAPAGDRTDLPGGVIAATEGRGALWISALTLAVTVIGFLSSAILGWRRELRQARLDRLQMEALRVEVEKMLLEIKQLRDNQ